MKYLLFILFLFLAVGCHADEMIPTNLDGNCVQQLGGQLQVNCRSQFNLVTISSLVATSISVSTLTVSTGTIPSFMVVGTTTNNNSPVGRIGEYISSWQSTATNFPTSATYGTLTSISLTAGDWDVSAVLDALQNGATITNVSMGIATVAEGAGNNFGDRDLSTLGPTAATDTSIAIASGRFSLTATTTINLYYLAVYSVATPKARGRISARRVR